MGCNLAQGIYFSEPLPGEAVGTLLETNVSG
jgi:EAL domain-containing protein (putative c-di-GMP-specific phosphodiesterase class I)